MEEKKIIFPYYAVVTMAQCIIASQKEAPGIDWGVCVEFPHKA